MTSSVLVLLTAPANAAATLAAAADAARALEAPAIEVLHVRVDPASTILPSEEVLTPARIRDVEAASLAEGTATHAAFAAWQAAGHQGSWTEVVGDPAEELRRRGPAAALVVLSLPAPHSALAERAALEAAVFGTGRPVLTVPPGWQNGFGRHLAVGWRDSPSTRRALTALRPWLAAAARLSVLSVTEGPVPPPDGPLAGLAGRMETQAVAPGAHGDGAALLAAAMAAGADGLAMGAYRRGRLIEFVLGGATEYVLHHAGLPLLLIH